MGGRVFNGTTPVGKKAVDSIVNEFNLLLNRRMDVNLYVIGSGYNMSEFTKIGDIDTLINERAVCKHFGVKTNKEARYALKNYFEELGFETALSGSTVHVKVTHEQQHHQLDMMFVVWPEDIAVFHRHSIPAGSCYKGFHKQMALFWVAKQNGLCWSAFQGLYTRDPQGVRDKLLAVDADYVASILIGPNATARDLGSFESICAAMDPVAREKMLSDLITDPSWIKYHEIH
jgi:hypothetical protein